MLLLGKFGGCYGNYCQGISYIDVFRSVSSQMLYHGPFKFLKLESTFHVESDQRKSRLPK